MNANNNRDEQKTGTSSLCIVCDSCRIGAVDPRQEAQASIEFGPTTAGSSVLLVNFDSDKLKNIKSFINVVVKEWASTEV